LSGFGLIGFFYLFFHQFNSNLIWLLILVPGNLFFLLATNILIGMNQIKIYNRIQLLSNSLILLIILLFGLFNLTVHYLITCISIYWLLIAFGLWVFLNKNRCGRFDFNWQYFKVSLHYGLKAYFITLFGLWILRGNVFLLKHFCNDEELGYFSVATQLYDCLLILPSSLGLILFPNLVKEDHQRKFIFYQGLKRSFILMCFASLFSLIFISGIVEFFFGKNFLPAVTIFNYLLPSAILLSLITIMSQYFASIGNSLTLIFIWLIASLIATVGGYFFIPLYQGCGAAVSLFFSYFILFILMLFLIKQNFKRS